MEATDANGHPVAWAEFAWASSDTLVAVDDAGLVTGVAAGEAEVTVIAAGVTAARPTSGPPWGIALQETDGSGSWCCLSGALADLFWTVGTRLAVKLSSE